MSEIIEDRVKETTTSTGTGNITLAGVILTSYRLFSSVSSVNDTMYVAIVAVDNSGNPTGQWEVSHCTYTAANTLRRDSVVSSSNNNQFVNFTAGTKQVFIDFTSAQIKAIPTSTTGGSGGGSGAPTPYGQNAALYTGLTFQDEFNGTTLDTNKWKNYIYYQSDQSANVTNYDVSGGNLRIWPQVNGAGNFFQRTIVTDGLFSQQYGFFECEAKLPTGSGVWPAFWLFNNDQHEIDVFEAYCGGGSPWGNGSKAPNNFGVSVWQDINTQVGTFRADGATAGSATLGSQSWAFPVLSDAFHKYGLHWDANQIRMYFDGVLFGTITHTTMRVPMYILFDIWYGSASGNTNPPDGTVTATPQGNTNSLLVNYVRVWQIA